MSNKNKPLTKWQKFKMWASRSFGCTSSYTVKDNPQANTRNGETRETARERGDASSKPKVNADLTDGTKAKPNQKPVSQQQSSTNAGPLEPTFSKDIDDIPYIDESMVNIPQAVK